MLLLKDTNCHWIQKAFSWSISLNQHGKNFVQSTHIELYCKTKTLVTLFGSWKLHLRMLYLRHLIFGRLSLWVVIPLEISPSGFYTLGMFHLRDVSPSGSYTFGSFTFGKAHLPAITPLDVSPSACLTFRHVHLQRFHLREVTPLDFSPSHVFRNLEGGILRSCNFPKVKHLKVELPKV